MTNGLDRYNKNLRKDKYGSSRRRKKLERRKEKDVKKVVEMLENKEVDEEVFVK